MDMEDCPSEIRLCILDCKSSLENFNVIRFQHVRRNKNNATHVLAKPGASCQNGVNWTGVYLPWLQREVDHKAMNCNQKI